MHLTDNKLLPGWLYIWKCLSMISSCHIFPPLHLQLCKHGTSYIDSPLLLKSCSVWRKYWIIKLWNYLLTGDVSYCDNNQSLFLSLIPPKMAESTWRCYDKKSKESWSSRERSKILSKVQRRFSCNIVS